MSRTRGFEQIIKNGEKVESILPKRATAGSAGYDFYALNDVTVPSVFKGAKKVVCDWFSNLFASKEEKEDIDLKKIFSPTLIETGVKSYMQKDEVLLLHNRSSNPIKRGLILGNGVGVIDSDYYSNPSNDGHIMFAFYNVFPWDITINKGDAIGQGIFQSFLVADDDDSTAERNGGFGSTNG